MLETVIDILEDFTDVSKSEINRESKLVADLGLCSIDVMNLAVEFENIFNFEIPEEDIREFGTVGDLIDYIESHK